MNTRRKHNLLLALAGLGIAIAFAPFVGPALAGPGTQTEDDIYVGKKRQAQSGAKSVTPATTPVQGFTPPRAATPQPRPGAGVSPNTGAVAPKRTARAGGDDDLDDLEVERRRVQGVNTPGTSTPQIRPGAGTSPNTGRSATPAPTLLPGKP